MGHIVRKQTDRMVYAATSAITDTRKGAAVAQTVSYGTLTLVSGTLALTGKGCNAQSFVDLMLTAPGGTTGAMYKVTGLGTTGGFTVTAISTAGATVTTDTSTLSWMATTPLYHGDQTPEFMSNEGAYPPAFTNLTVTAPTAVDLPTTIVAANQIRQVLLQMMADTVAHVAADTTNIATLAAVPVCVDLPSAQTLLNQCQTSFNAHLTQAGVHVYNDTVNTNATTAASNLATSEALAIALALSINAHLASAPTGESVTVIAE